jgi:DNA replication and repair protein RecF
VHIEKLTIKCFKNHQDSLFEFCSGINCIHGANGVGKTNVLDAIYFLGNGRSYFTRHDQQSIPFSKSFARFQGDFIDESKESQHLVVLKDDGKKSIERNGSLVRKLSDIVGQVPVVIITPSDIQLINGQGDERRKFIDRAIALMKPAYVKNLQRYKRLLLMRNETLKKFAMDRNVDLVMLEGIDNQIIPEANAIYEQRKWFTEKLAEEVIEIYSWLSDDEETVSLKYSSPLKYAGMSELLLDNRQNDLLAQRTGQGVHRDDIDFELDNVNVKKYSSQGQIKTLTISLHLAVFRILSSEMKLIPILLLDDIYEKIDDHRAKKLMSLIANNGYGQIFITDTSEERMRNRLNDIDTDKKFFNIERRMDASNPSEKTDE